MTNMLEASRAGPSLSQLRVADAMHPGVISCPPETPLRSVARMMSTYRVHSIIVHPHGVDAVPELGEWTIVTDADVAAAAIEGDLDRVTAGQIGGAAALTVMADDGLDGAAHLMVERHVAHVVAVDRRSRRPIGMLSTLDVIRAVAGFS